MRLGARCVEGVRSDPKGSHRQIGDLDLGWRVLGGVVREVCGVFVGTRWRGSLSQPHDAFPLFSFLWLLAKYFRIFGPLKKPMFAEDLERNKILALNRNILAIYIGESFSEYWRSFGYVWRQKKDEFGDKFERIFAS